MGSIGQGVYITVMEYARMYQKLLTKEILGKIPPLYSQEKVKDPIVWVKFFAPWTGWSWFATEYSPKEKLFFGYVVGQESELGYFSLEELESVNGPFGLKIERDTHFDPKPLSMVEAGKESECYELPKDITKRRKSKVHTSGLTRTRRKPMYGASAEMRGIR